MDPDARQGRVADVALGRLQTNGFAGTTLEDIARDAGLGEADLRARFGDMEGLMGELVSPLLDRLRELARSAAAADLHRAPEVREVIAGYYDVLVADPVVVGVVLRDPTAESSGSVRLVRTVMTRLRAELAGGAGADLDRTIRAASALAAVQSAVLDLAGLDRETVRDVVTGAAVAILLSVPGMEAGP
jgi:AcrR family transcriptional regulator